MHLLEALAPLYAYPGPGYADRASICAAAAQSPDLDAFAAAMAALTVTRQQELFVETFDLRPAATLEIGWHLFGEQYERGAFLVDLRGKLRRAGIAESGELPDHLVHVLPLVARMPDEEAEAFTTSALLPALDRIAAALPEGNPFIGLVRGTRACAAPVEAAGARA